MNTNGSQRQGDVMFRTTPIPKTATPLKKNKKRVVFAYGEVTGHAHAVYEPEKIEMFEDRSGETIRQFMRVLADTFVKHEEHSAIPLKAGEEYEIVRQRQYDWFAERAVQVAD